MTMSLDWFRAEWNQTIHFGAGSPYRKHLLPGSWGADEPAPGVWSAGAMSRMAFRLPLPQNEPFLVIDALAFVPSPQVSAQPAEIRLNGVLLGHFTFTQPDRSIAIMPLARDAFSEQPISVLSFILPNARSPAELGLSSDPRKLAIRVFRLRWVDIWYDSPFRARILTTAAAPHNGYYVFGWSSPEPGFVWSEGPTSFLGLRIPAVGHDLLFRAHLHAFVPRLDLPPLNLRLFANGRPVGEFAFRDASWRTVEAKIPAECVRADRLVFLRFEVDSPRRPADFGFPHDLRELGVALAWFSIEPAGTQQQAYSRFSRIGARSGASAATQPPQNRHISFRKGELDPRSLIYGWGEPSEDGTPLERSPAILALDLKRCPDRSNLLCSFELRKSELFDQVKVRTQLNALPAGSFSLSEAHPPPVTLIIWPMMRQIEELTYLTFEWSTCREAGCVPVLRSLAVVPFDAEPTIREALAPGASLRFRTDSHGASQYLGFGWDLVCEEGAINDGWESQLLLPLADATLPLEVILEIGPVGFLPASGEAKNVLATVNGRPAACFELGSNQVVRLALSPPDVLGGAVMDIRFRASNDREGHPAGLCEALTGDSIDARVLRATLAVPLAPAEQVSSELAQSGFCVSPATVYDVWLDFGIASLRQRLQVANRFRVGMPNSPEVRSAFRWSAPRFLLRRLRLSRPALAEEA